MAHLGCGMFQYLFTIYGQNSQGLKFFGHAIVKMFHMSWYPSLNITWLVKYIAGDIKFMVNGKIKIRHTTGELV